MTAGSAATFTATVEPADAAQPITYTWQAPGQAPVVHTGGLADSADLTLTGSGSQVVTVTAVNECQVAVTASHQLTVEPATCPIPLKAVELTGPSAGVTGVTYAFTGIVSPTEATEPITYTWTPEPFAGQGTSSAGYSWSQTGTYSLTLMAQNCGGEASAIRVIDIQQGMHATYLPLIVRPQP